MSFACSLDELLDSKKHKEIIATVTKLKGSWKLSYGDKVNFYIMPRSLIERMGRNSVAGLLKKSQDMIHVWMKKLILKVYLERKGTMSNKDYKEILDGIGSKLICNLTNIE